jgi:ribosomal protein S18 acetylase RimI-like enzyme
MVTANGIALLDNPIWHSLTSCHTRFAAGDGLARRFGKEIGPLTGMREQSAEAYRNLAELLSPEDAAVLFLDSTPELPAEWRMHLHLPLDQMICERVPVRQVGEFAIQALGEADVPEMMELAALTEPGPFRARTYELGGFVGIREGGQLVAMAGNRLALPGFLEVSAVCTHPDFRGRGYAQALVAEVAGAIYERGETPILHVLSSNTSAIRVYQSVGFELRRRLDLAVAFAPKREI